MSELRYSIDKYMKKYNSKRLHSAIGNKTPNEVYYEAINCPVSPRYGCLVS
jgi:transposase InsO family protein